MGLYAQRGNLFWLSVCCDSRDREGRLKILVSMRLLDLWSSGLMVWEYACVMAGLSVLGLGYGSVTRLLRDLECERRFTCGLDVDWLCYDGYGRYRAVIMVSISVHIADDCIANTFYRCAHHPSGAALYVLLHLGRIWSFRFKLFFVYIIIVILGVI